ncbi:hypothetical protein ACGFNV_35090 [Streptomyces sp. NPDC048751]|uniref:hypothetical protein n=1 Tax=Streptomyces sp. NPDC048751 TaxID=3365591 RepID=UPI0037107290
MDSPATERAGRELAAEVSDVPPVTDVTSYRDADSTALRGEEGRRALIWPASRPQGARHRHGADCAD